MSFIERFSRLNQFVVILLAMFLWLGFSGLPARGQVLSGSIVGTVTDPSQAVIPGAQVAIRDLGTNQVLRTTTNASGLYSFEVLQPGTYEVKVTKSGFSAAVLNGISVSVNNVARADLVLRVGSVSQTVTVSAGTARLQTETADVHEQLSTVALSNLPVQPGRNFQALLGTQPGFTPPQTNTSIPGNPDRSLEFTVNGANQEGIVTRIDGATSSNIWRPYAIAYVPSLEAVASVSAVTDSFTAENGTAGGAVINVTIKSGTNDLHGSAFESYDGSATEARPYFLPKGQSKGTLVENQFGGSLARISHRY